MTKDEALRLALEALKWNWGGEPLPTLELEAITAIEQALAQPNEFNPDWDAMAVMVEEQQRMAKRIAELEAQSEQEPVAYINVEQRKLEWAKYMTWDTPTVVNLPKIPLYTTPPQPMHPEIKKMYEDYFDKCYRESSSAVPENFIDALRFDVAVRDAREWEEVDMREHAEGNLGIGTAPPPPQRTWVGLTAKEKHEFRYSHMTTADFIEGIEAKLKEKNT